MINATEGFCLEVRSGCLWLTRPGDAVDRFLVAGSKIDLHENLVLIQSDRQPGVAADAPAWYALIPLLAPVALKPSQSQPFSWKRFRAAPSSLQLLFNI